MNNIAYRAEFYNEYIHFLSFNSELHPTDNEACKDNALQAYSSYVEEADDATNKASQRMRLWIVSILQLPEYPQQRNPVCSEALLYQDHHPVISLDRIRFLLKSLWLP